MAHNLQSNQSFESKYDEKNQNILNKVKNADTISKALNILKTELANSLKEDEKELGRPLTYAEMRMRYG